MKRNNVFIPRLLLLVHYVTLSLMTQVTGSLPSRTPLRRRGWPTAWPGPVARAVCWPAAASPAASRARAVVPATAGSGAAARTTSTSASSFPRSSWTPGNVVKETSSQRSTSTTMRLADWSVYSYVHICLETPAYHACMTLYIITPIIRTPLICIANFPDRFVN